MMMARHCWKGGLLLLFALTLLSGCEGCETKARPLSLPFQDNFDRPTLGKQWTTERPGRWKIEYDRNTKQGKLCVWQARNMPLFLKNSLPDNVKIEFDAWAHQRAGDVKVEVFTDGRFHATGYVLVHGGWNNSWSIIDRLDEHNRNCRRSEMDKPVHCRRIKRGGPTRNKRYRWTIIRSSNKLSWRVNGKPFLHYPDPAPLRGKHHRHFAFGNWIARVCFDNLRISRYQAPTAMQTPQRPQAPAPAKAVAHTPPAPVPAPVRTMPQPTQPPPPVHRKPVPKVNRLPQPGLLRLQQAQPQNKKLRLYRPRILNPAGLRSRSLPQVYRQKTLRIHPNHR